MSMPDYACPKCRSTRLNVLVSVWRRLEQDSPPGSGNMQTTDDNDDHDEAWDEHSPMECEDCTWKGEACQCNTNFKTWGQHHGAQR